VLVVDWKMPGLDGAEVARRARALDPQLAVLMITGDPREAAVAAAPAAVHRILHKPFRIDEFVAEVAALAAGAEDPEGSPS
jgi:DNA-binding response OmpR family regulator